MTPTVVAIVVLAVVIAGIVWAVRRRRIGTAHRANEPDTAWNDPITPARPPNPDQTERKP